MAAEQSTTGQDRSSDIQSTLPCDALLNTIF